MCYSPDRHVMAVTQIQFQLFEGIFRKGAELRKLSDMVFRSGQYREVYNLGGGPDTVFILTTPI